MFKSIQLSLMTLLICSCSEYSKVKPINGGFEITPGSLKVLKAKSKPWEVGKKGKFVISRGVEIQIEVPKIKKKFIDEMIKTNNIDSAIIEIGRKYQGYLIPIGAMKIPLNILSKRNLDSLSFDILYHSASVRPSFTLYTCVPYNESYILKDLDIKNYKTLNDSLTVLSLYNKNYKNIILPFQVQNQTFTSGKNLKGEFMFKFAFYNSLEHQTRSSFYEYQEIVIIKEEEKVTIPGCETYNGDGKQRNEGKKFKWKR
jgi:hypothetical protein